MSTLGLTSNASVSKAQNSNNDNSIDIQSRSFTSSQEDITVETIGLAVFKKDKLIRNTYSK